MSRRVMAILVATAVIVSLLPLVVQAGANEWHAPALVPQRFGWRGIDAVFGDPLLGRAVFNSFVVATIAVALALAIGWPAARALAVADRPGPLVVLIAAPLLVPGLVVGDGLSVWFLRLHLADHLLGVALAHLVYVLPYVILALTPGFTRQVFDADEAASTLGASRPFRLSTVTLPAVRSSLWLAIGLGFIISWSQFGTSLGVGGGLPMLPLVLVPFVRSDPQIAAVLDLVFLVPPLVVLLLAGRRHVHTA
ncbi:MAG: hypothetical protein WD271_16400 [Acidimicrobiia bacterium]